MSEDIHTPYERRQFMAECEADNRPCHICHQPIDYTLPPGRAGTFELDHLIPRTQAPELIHEPSNWAPAHLTCNRARGTKPLESVAVDLGTPSEPW